jgi:8-amino-7-oxononanoate synthase
VVTEGVFSMEGDAAPLGPLAELAERHDALVYLDDAHGAFVLGATGRGSPEAAGVPHDRFLYMGALGKALGCQGGFVAGPAPLIDWLQNRARTFLYTTALAVPVAAAAVAALEQLAADDRLRLRLAQRVQRLHERLTPVVPSGLGPPSHIVPVVVGEAGRALELSQRLWDRGCWVPAVRPPTVPQGTARLRLSVTALHTDAQIDALAEALRDALSVGSPQSAVGSKGATTDSSGG